MKLNKVLPTKKRKMEQKTESVLSAVTSGLCFDFHPTVSLSKTGNRGFGLTSFSQESFPIVWFLLVHRRLLFTVYMLLFNTSLVRHLCSTCLLQDFSIYLVGTFEGLVYQGSSSNTQHFLETYRKHSVSPQTKLNVTRHLIVQSKLILCPQMSNCSLSLFHITLKFFSLCVSSVSSQLSGLVSIQQ